MGTSAAETVREIDEIRGRLSTDLEELQERLPAPAVWGKRLLGVAAGGGLAGTLFWFGVRRLRRKRRSPRSAPAQAVVQVLPEDLVDRITEKLEDQRVRQWLLALGGAWLLFKLAELRQLRKLRRSSVA